MNIPEITETVSIDRQGIEHWRNNIGSEGKAIIDKLSQELKIINKKDTQEQMVYNAGWLYKNLYQQGSKQILYYVKGVGLLAGRQYSGDSTGWIYQETKKLLKEVYGTTNIGSLDLYRNPYSGEGTIVVSDDFVYSAYNLQRDVGGIIRKWNTTNREPLTIYLNILGWSENIVPILEKRKESHPQKLTIHTPPQQIYIKCLGDVINEQELELLNTLTGKDSSFYKITDCISVPCYKVPDPKSLGRCQNRFFSCQKKAHYHRQEFLAERFIQENTIELVNSAIGRKSMF